MKTTDESYLNRIKRVSTLSKFSRYKLIKNSKIDFNSATKEFNKISNRLENLYLSREDQKTFRKNKRYLLVKTFTFKMKNKIVSTVPVSQDEINILNSITPINIDEKIQDFKIINFYFIVSLKSSFQEAYDFVKSNYTKKELLLIDNSIPDYEGYNWTKKEGIRHLISRLDFDIAS